MTFSSSGKVLRNHISCLYSNDVNLRFTSEISSTEVNFLDLKVFVSDNKINTALYRKPTAGNSVLHAESSHPPNLIYSIPYEELLCIKRNSTREVDFQKKATESVKRFEVIGYQKGVLNRAMKRVENKDRADLMKDEPKVKDRHVHNNFRMITNFSSAASNIRRIMQGNWRILKPDQVIG